MSDRLESRAEKLESSPIQYIISIPESWFEATYPGWNRMFYEDRHHILEKVSKRFRDEMISQVGDSLFQVLSPDYIGWDVTVIPKKYRASQDLIEWIAGEFEKKEEVVLQKHSDLGSQIIKLAKMRKEEKGE